MDDGGPLSLSVSVSLSLSDSFEPEGREPSPARLVEGYFHSAATANFIRVALKDGLADLRQANEWDMVCVCVCVCVCLCLCLCACVACSLLLPLK